MHRHYEYCSKCGGIRDLVVSISLKKVTAPDGSLKEILIRNYHCETCTAFIYSAEEREEAAFIEQEAPVY